MFCATEARGFYDDPSLGQVSSCGLAKAATKLFVFRLKLLPLGSFR